MAKINEPPGIRQLQVLTPPIHTLPANAHVARVFFSGGPYPAAWNELRDFGPLSGRFEHLVADPSDLPQRQSRKILYLASGSQAVPTALVEVFQDRRTILCKSKDPVLVVFRLERDLRLLDLTGPFATQMGASMTLHSGPKPITRRWARQLYEAFPTTDGILYCSSMNANKPSIALYERGADAIPARPKHHWYLTDAKIRSRLLRIALRFGFKLA